MAGPGGLSTGVKASVAVIPDVSRFLPDLKKYIKRIEHQLRVELPTSLDLTGAKADFAALKEDLQHDKLQIQADVESIQAEVRKQVEVASRTAPAVRIKAVVDRKHLGLVTLLGSLTDALNKRALKVVKTFAGFVPPLAAAAATAVTIAPSLIKAGEAVSKYGHAALAAAPMLLSLAASTGVIIATLKAVVPALGKPLKPIGDEFSRLGKEAANAATKGVRPLARAFADATFPVMERSIRNIGAATGDVVKSFLEWGKSRAGIQAITNIVAAASSAFQRITPAISRFVVALGNMLGRIAGVSADAGAKGLISLLDHMSAAMDRVNADSVTAALDTLKAGARKAADAVRATFAAISAAVGFYKTYETQIKAVADGLAVLAIAFGGPAVAAVAAAGLIIRHWDKVAPAVSGAVAGVKAAAPQIQATLAPLTTGLQNFGTSIGASFAAIGPGLAAFGSAILPVLQNFGNQVLNVIGPALTSIGTIIQTQVAPAFNAFLIAVAPVAAFFTRVFGQEIIAALKIAIGVIKGALQIIAGILNVFAGLFSGDWSRLWQGLGQIVKGAWTAIGAIVKGALTLLKIVISGAWTEIKTVTGRVWEGIQNLLGIAWNAIKAFVSKGVSQVRSTISGAWNAVRSATSAAFNAVVSAVKGAMGKLASAVSSGVGKVVAFFKGLGGKILGAIGDLGGILFNAGKQIIQGFIDGIGSMFGAVKGKLGDLTGSLTSWKGPPPRDKTLLTPSGQMIIQGLIDGFTKSEPKVKATLGRITKLIQSSVRGFAEGLSAITAPGASEAGTILADKLRTALTPSLTAVIVKDTKALGLATSAYLKAAKAHGKGAKQALDAAQQAIAAATGKLATDLLQQGTDKLAKVVALRQAIADRLQAAQDSLAQAITLRDNYAKSVADSTRQFGSLIAEQTEGRALSAANVVKQLKAKVAAITAFRSNLAKLQASGLSDAALQQLVDAGVSAGSATAAALAKGGQESIQQVNDLTANISAQADQLGTDSAARFYQAGVNAAQGLVSGLQSQFDALDQAMTDLANRLVATFKKRLGIKSPSAVMATLGDFIGQGLVQGMDGSRRIVQAATDRMASAAIPVMASASAAGAGGIGGSGGVNVYVTNPVPETASESTTRIMRRLAVLGPAA